MSLLTLEEACEGGKGACEVEGAGEETFGVPGEIMGTYGGVACADGAAAGVWKGPEGEPRARGFWARQFAAETKTGAQSRFDIAFGIVIPVLCFLFDPVIFQDRFGGGIGGFYRQFRFYAYALSAAEVLALACWLHYGARASRWAGLASGLFLAGAVFSLALGVAILPLSVFGLIIVIGALGFVPFVTAFVYARQAVRALALARTGSESGARTAAWVALGLVFGLVAPAAGQHGANRAVVSAFVEAMAGRELSAPRVAATRLLAGASGSTFDEAVWAYERETDPARRARLAKAYAQVTGGDIEKRLARLND